LPSAITNTSAHANAGAAALPSIQRSVCLPPLLAPEVTRNSRSSRGARYRASPVVLLSAVASLLVTTRARAEEGPPPRRMSPVVSGGIWTAAQLIPSPLLVAGKQHVGGRLRWQVTPLLYSFGIAERPLRYFFVAPIARHSGSVELHASEPRAAASRISHSRRAGRVPRRASPANAQPRPGPRSRRHPRLRRTARADPEVASATPRLPPRSAA
jgi:hypothetical protein